MTKKQLNQRLAFIAVYDEFTTWLRGIGFKSVSSSTAADFHYSHYDEKIDSLYGVEYYEHGVLKIGLRFMRDREKHLIMFVGQGLYGAHSSLMPLEKVQEAILEDVLNVRDKMLKDLSALTSSIVGVGVEMSNN